MKNRFRRALLALPISLLIASAATPAEEPRGHLAGVVTFMGAVPAPHKIMTTDGGTILHHDLVVNPKTKGLRYAFLILENAPAQAKAQKTKPVIVDQRDMVFLPRVVAVHHGQAVRFENNDLGNHSVMANSIVEANQLNAIAVPGQPIEHVFVPQKPPVQIGCALHGWMRAWVYVAPHPWFAVSDEQGKFQIRDIPAGKYTLWMRHADSGYQERRAVVVQAGRTLDLNLEVSTVSKK